MTYDGEGHRIRLVETTAGGSPTVTTTDFTYEGDAVVREVEVTGGLTITRTFTTDESGAIVKMTRATSGGSTADDGTYLVTGNGHGDTIGLAEIHPTTGVLTSAARVSYSTWGTPTVTAVNGYGDLGFRYLYVGRFDVQWDDFAGAGLHYMHARHYSPEFGRFLQPDPSALEANLYGYSENSPVTKIDPSGTCAFLCVIAVAFLVSAVVSAGSYVAAQHAAHRPIRADQVAIAFFVGGAAGAGCVASRSLAMCGRINAAASTLQYHLSTGPKNPEGYLLSAWLGWVLRRWSYAPYVPRPPRYAHGLSWWILYGYPGMSKVATAFRSLMASTGTNWSLDVVNEYYDGRR